MSISQALLPEFDQEMATTRKLLERVPSDKGAWKPHPKSFALGHLAQSPQYTLETTDALLDRFDGCVGEAREALKHTKDSDFIVPWSLKHGDRVLFTAPRGVVVRQHINHLVHHRGQLSVYLRLNDIPVPALYGPSADEQN